MYLLQFTVISSYPRRYLSVFTAVHGHFVIFQKIFFCIYCSSRPFRHISEDIFLYLLQFTLISSYPRRYLSVFTAVHGHFVIFQKISFCIYCSSKSFRHIPEDIFLYLLQFTVISSYPRRHHSIFTAVHSHFVISQKIFCIYCSSVISSYPRRHHSVFTAVHSHFVIPEDIILYLQQFTLIFPASTSVPTAEIKLHQTITPLPT
jgi:hypothetical protein